MSDNRWIRSAVRVMAVIGAFSFSSLVHAAERDVQIRSVDFEKKIIELHNFAATDQPLDGFRFCTQDDDETRRYTAAFGLNGVTIESGTSFFIHLLDDAPSGDDSINASALGGSFAGPLDSGPYGLSFYFPQVRFGDGTTMADHVQWNIDGEDDDVADERSDEAEAGGVWTDQSAWVVTAKDTGAIELNDLTGAHLHGPKDYDSRAGCADPVNYESGIAGSGGFVPTIAADGGSPRIGNDQFSIAGGQILGGAYGFLLIGLDRAQLPFAGGFLLVDPSPPFLIISVAASGPSGTPGAGTVNVPAAIPHEPAYVGIELAMQFLFFDDGAVQGLSASDGLSFVFCSP